MERCVVCLSAQYVALSCNDSGDTSLPRWLCTGVQQQEQPIRIQGSLKRVWRLKDGAESGAKLKGTEEAQGGVQL